MLYPWYASVIKFLWCIYQTTIKEIKFEEEEAAGQEDGTSPVIEKDVELLASLKWSDTDNFYMNLGCHKGKSSLLLIIGIPL